MLPCCPSLSILSGDSRAPLDKNIKFPRVVFEVLLCKSEAMLIVTNNVIRDSRAPLDKNAKFSIVVSEDFFMQT